MSLLTDQHGKLEENGETNLRVSCLTRTSRVGLQMVIGIFAELPGVGTFLSGLTKHPLTDEDFPLTATRSLLRTTDGQFSRFAVDGGQGCCACCGPSAVTCHAQVSLLI